MTIDVDITTNAALEASYAILYSAFDKKIPFEKRKLLHKTAKDWAKTTPFKIRDEFTEEIKKVAVNNHLTLFTLVFLGALIKGHADVTFIATREMAVDIDLLSVLKNAHIPFYVALNLFKNLPNQLLEDFLPTHVLPKDLLPQFKVKQLKRFSQALFPEIEEHMLENFLNDLLKNIPEIAPYLFKNLSYDIFERFLLANVSSQDLLRTLKEKETLFVNFLKDLILPKFKEKALENFLNDISQNIPENVLLHELTSEVRAKIPQALLNCIPNNTNILNEVPLKDLLRTLPEKQRINFFHVVYDTAAGTFNEIQPQKGATELTQVYDDVYDDGDVDGLPFPVISANMSRTKLPEKYLGPGDGGVRGLIARQTKKWEHMPDVTPLTVTNYLFKENKTYVIFGCGGVGRGAAGALERNGVPKKNITMVDEAEKACIYVKRTDKYTNVYLVSKDQEKIKDALKKAYCVITATGKENCMSIYKPEEIPGLKMNLSTSRDWGTNFPDVLNNGELFNFSLLEYDEFPTDPRLLDLTFSAWGRAGAFLATQPKLANKLYPLYREEQSLTTETEEERELSEQLSMIDRDCLVQWGARYPNIIKPSDLPHDIFAILKVGLNIKKSDAQDSDDQLLADVDKHDGPHHNKSYFTQRRSAASGLNKYLTFFRSSQNDEEEDEDSSFYKRQRTLPPEETVSRSSSPESMLDSSSESSTPTTRSLSPDPEMIISTPLSQQSDVNFSPEQVEILLASNPINPRELSKNFVIGPYMDLSPCDTQELLTTTLPKPGL